MPTRRFPPLFPSRLVGAQPRQCLSIIVACARNRVIGLEGRLPWHLPADLKYFRQVTLGKPILMGRRTYQSIGHPLPGRHNLVLTRSKEFQAPGCTLAHSWREALRLVANAPELMIIGGAELYRQALPHAQRIYLSEVEADCSGDLHFPLLPGDEWVEVSRCRRSADAQNSCALHFVILQRVMSAPG